MYAEVGWAASTGVIIENLLPESNLVSSLCRWAYASDVTVFVVTAEVSGWVSVDIECGSGVCGS